MSIQQFLVFVPIIVFICVGVYFTYRAYSDGEFEAGMQWYIPMIASMIFVGGFQVLCSICLALYLTVWV